jgi:hypothetical protein
MVTPAKVCIGKRNEETSAVPSTVVGSDDLDTGSLRRRAARPAAAPAHPPSRAAATKWGATGWATTRASSRGSFVLSLSFNSLLAHCWWLRLW